jgi:hypothetical protein
MDHGEEGKIMAKLDARKSGSFKINGDIEIHRLGFGAMRITGPRENASGLSKLDSGSYTASIRKCHVMKHQEILLRLLILLPLTGCLCLSSGQN